LASSTICAARFFSLGNHFGSLDLGFTQVVSGLFGSQFKFVLATVACGQAVGDLLLARFGARS